MKDLLTVLTAPRRSGKNYLPDTLASLDRAGADLVSGGKLVVTDGEMGVETLASGYSPFPWKTRSLGPSSVGNLKAFFGVLRVAAELGCERLLYFEDDVAASRHAIRRMLDVGVPEGMAWTSFFDMKEMPRGVPFDLYRISTMGREGWGFWGMQALLIPRTSIDFLLPRAQGLCERFSGTRHYCDYLSGYEMLFSKTSSYALHVPDLFEHVGEVSAIWDFAASWDGYEVNRRSTSFQGEGFDALSLPPYSWK